MLKKERVNIYLAADLKNYYQEKAQETGLSMSQLMQIALVNYREQQSLMNSMPEILDKMQSLIKLQGKEMK